MNECRKLNFENGVFVGCDSGLETDNEGNKGVWCTNDNGGKYFLRVGETVLQAKERAEKVNQTVEIKLDTEIQKKFDNATPKERSIIAKQYIVKFLK